MSSYATGYICVGFANLSSYATGYICVGFARIATRQEFGPVPGRIREATPSFEEVSWLVFLFFHSYRERNIKYMSESVSLEIALSTIISNLAIGDLVNPTKN